DRYRRALARDQFQRICIRRAREREGWCRHLNRTSDTHRLPAGQHQPVLRQQHANFVDAWLLARGGDNAIWTRHQKLPGEYAYWSPSGACCRSVLSCVSTFGVDVTFVLVPGGGFLCTISTRTFPLVSVGESLSWLSMFRAMFARTPDSLAFVGRSYSDENFA